MTDDTLRTLLRDAEGRTYCFGFMDCGEMLAEVVSATHVDADDTIVLLRAGALPDECAWQVNLADIRSVAAPGGSCLFSRAEPGPAPDSGGS
jgi:hypothetical protein